MADTNNSTKLNLLESICTIQQIITLTKDFVEVLNDHPDVDIEDIKILNEIDKSVSVDLDSLQAMMTNDALASFVSSPEVNESASMTTVTTESPTIVGEVAEPWLSYVPDAEWVEIRNQPNIVVSDKGHVWDKSINGLRELYFIDGDMRYLEDENDVKTAKRVAPLICKAFGIRTIQSDNKIVLEYKDGDRRNLSPNNMRWVEEVERVNPVKTLVEDICQRLVEHNGNIDEVMPLYKNARPMTNRFDVEAILKKRSHRDVSDKYFTYNNGTGEFKVRNHIREYQEAGEPGFDIIGSYLELNLNLDMCLKLLKDKVIKNQKITDQEWAFAVKAYRKKDKSMRAPEIAGAIKADFDKDLPLDLISAAIADKTSAVAVKMGV